MANKTMYAWSKFKKEINEWGRVDSWINAGEKVSQSDLGVDDEEWQSLIDAGVIREEPYPDIPEHTSPAEYFKENPDEEAPAGVDVSAAAVSTSADPVEVVEAPADGDVEEKKPNWMEESKK